MAITASQLKATFPEFSAVAEATIDIWIAQAGNRIADAAWGVKRDDGALFLTAHLLKLSIDGSVHDAGPVSSEKTLSTSASYSVGDAFTNDALGSTSYGRYYIGLRRTVFADRQLT